MDNEKEIKSITIHPALFIVFAEFLGYSSPLIDWSEDICDVKEVDDFKRTFVKVEAAEIFKKMKEEYTVAEIRQWYESFYPVILKDYAEKLDKELPF